MSSVTRSAGVFAAFGQFTFAVQGRASDGQETLKSVKYFVVPRHH